MASPKEIPSSGIGRQRRVDPLVLEGAVVGLGVAAAEALRAPAESVDG